MTNETNMKTNETQNEVAKVYVVRRNGLFIAKGSYEETKWARGMGRKYTVREAECDKECVADARAYHEMSQAEKDAHDNL